jgi:hypothetical protein
MASPDDHSGDARGTTVAALEERSVERASWRVVLMGSGVGLALLLSQCRI